MAKKLKELTKQGENVQQELLAKQKELELLVAELEKEKEAEIKRRENIKAEFDGLCVKYDLFCGVVLGIEDLTNIIKLMASGSETVKVPFMLYYNEDIESESKT